MIFVPNYLRARHPRSLLFSEPSDNHLTAVTGGGVLTYPFSCSAWIKVTGNLDLENTICGLFNDGGSSNHVWLSVDGEEAGDPIRCASRGGATFGAHSASGVTVNRWHHAGGVWLASEENIAYLDGASGSPAGAGAITLGETFAVGTQVRASPNDSFEGLISTVTWWNRQLTDDDMRLLSLGIDQSLLYPQDIVAHWLLGKDGPGVQFDRSPFGSQFHLAPESVSGIREGPSILELEEVDQEWWLGGTSPPAAGPNLLTLLGVG